MPYYQVKRYISVYIYFIINMTKSQWTNKCNQIRNYKTLAIGRLPNWYLFEKKNKLANYNSNRINRQNKSDKINMNYFLELMDTYTFKIDNCLSRDIREVQKNLKQRIPPLLAILEPLVTQWFTYSLNYKY